MCVDASLWSLDRLPQSRVTLVHLGANAIPLGLRIPGQEVPQKLVRLGNCLVLSLLGFLEYLLGLLSLHLAGLHVNIQQDGSLGTIILQGILQGSRQLNNSLAQLPALRVKAFLLDDAENSDNVCKAFLLVPLEKFGHVEVGPIRKFHLQSVQHFLGGYKIRQWDVRDGWPTAQLPFLALRIIQSFESYEGGTHLGMLPECGTQHESLKHGSQRNL